MPQISTLGVTYTSIAAWIAAEGGQDYGVGNSIILEYKTLVNESVAITGACVRGYIMRPATGFELNKKTLIGVGNSGDTRPNISTPGALAAHYDLILPTTSTGATTDLLYEDCLMTSNFNALTKKVTMRGTIHVGMSRALDASSGNTFAIAERCTAIDNTGAFSYVRFHCTDCLTIGPGYAATVAGSNYNASTDATAPGANSLHNRTTTDLVNYAGGDYRTALNSVLATSGSVDYIGFALESSAAAPIITLEPLDVTVDEGISWSITSAATGADSSERYKDAAATGNTTNTFSGTGTLAESGSYLNRYTNVAGSVDTNSSSVVVSPLVTEITINNVQSIGSESLVYTPASVVNSALVVSISSEDFSANEPITGAFFDGVPMVLVGVAQGFIGASPEECAIAYMVNPPNTSGVITVAGGEVGSMSIIACTLSSVDQSNPVDVFAITNMPAASDIVGTGTTTQFDGSLVISAAAYGNVGALSVTGGAKIAEISPVSSGSTMAMATSTNATAGAYWHAYTTTVSHRFCAMSVAFRLAPPVTTIEVSGMPSIFDYSADNGIVDLTGEVLITGSTSSMDAVSISGEVDLTGHVEVNGQLSDFDFLALGGAVDVSGEISVTGKHSALDYVTHNGLIDLTGEIKINGASANLDYISNGGMVSIGGLIDIKGQSASFDFGAVGGSTSLIGHIKITGDVATLSYQAVSGNITLVKGEKIGTVTAGFADDVISVQFRQ